MNGYPLHLVQGVINKSWEKETIKTILKENPLPENDQKKKGYYDILHAPYIQGFTENLQKKLHRLNIGMVHKKGDTIKQIICHTKQKVSKMQQKNVSIDLIAENVRAGTLVKQGRKWRKGHTSIKMM